MAAYIYFFIQYWTRIVLNLLIAQWMADPVVMPKAIKFFGILYVIHELNKSFSNCHRWKCIVLMYTYVPSWTLSPAISLDIRVTEKRVARKRASDKVCLDLQSWLRREYISQKLWYLSTSLYDVITQKKIFSSIALRTINSTSTNIKLSLEEKCRNMGERIFVKWPEDISCVSHARSDYFLKNGRFNRNDLR